MSSQRAEQSPGITPSYSYQGIQQCDANPVPAESVTTVVILRSYQYEMRPNVKKQGRAVVVEAAAAALAAASTAADPGFSRIATPADRPTAPVVGLLPEAAQLGCIPGLETA